MIRGHFLIILSYLHHVKEPVINTFFFILKCTLKTGFTVLLIIIHWFLLVNKYVYISNGCVIW